MIALDLARRKFGKWSVGTERKTINGKVKWLCRCDCGTERWVTASYLASINGPTGCLECREPPARAARYQAGEKGLGQFWSKRPCAEGHYLRWTHNSRCAICWPGQRRPLLSKEERLLPPKEREGLRRERRLDRRRKFRDKAKDATYRRRNAVWAKVREAKRRERPHVKILLKAARHRRYVNVDKKRYKMDIQYKLRLNLRRRIGSAIRHKSKGGSAVRDLGCSIEEFKLHIERQFTGRMTWANYGRVWVLDHRVPLAAFDLSDREQFLRAAHFTNYQPLTRKANGQKKDKRELLL